MPSSGNSLLIPALRPVYGGLSQAADALLRVVAGLWLMPHGAQKLFGWFGGPGLSQAAQSFEDLFAFAGGYATALAAGSVEFFGGLLLALGLATRVAAAAGFVLLAVATTRHIGDGFFWGDSGWEYPALWAVVMLVYVAKGGGRYSLDRAIGREI